MLTTTFKSLHKDSCIIKHFSSLSCITAAIAFLLTSCTVPGRLKIITISPFKLTVIKVVFPAQAYSMEKSQKGNLNWISAIYQEYAVY